MTLKPYWGEFMLQPAPLELSLSRCSHNCVYCFANLNTEERDPDLVADLRLLRDYGSRSTFAARLLQEGYPVVVSNRCDPFSANNYKQAIPILKTMAEVGVPVFYQTRGGYGIDDVLEFAPPATWYVTIETLDDDLGKALSPGAPPPSERLKLVRQLVDAGHLVLVGFNPCVPEWQADPEPLLRAVKDAGAWGVWIEPLHLNYRQQRAMTERGKALLGEDLLNKARKRIESPDALNWRRSVEQAADAVGIESFSSSLDKPTRFWEPVYAMYPKLFANLQVFVNWCYETKPKLVEFADLWRLFEPTFPQGEYNIDSYFRATVREICWQHAVPRNMTFEQVMAISWMETRARWCPAAMTPFAYALEMKEDGLEPMVDERGIYKMAFIPERTFSWWEVADGRLGE